MTLIAKPLVKNQSWIVTDGLKKVGNLQQDDSGYKLQIGGVDEKFPDTRTIQRMVAIEFQRPQRPSRFKEPYAVWPTCGRTYNNAYDVKRRLHVYTKTRKSRCYYAAGWFQLKIGEVWQTTFCPKYIFIQRYEYRGPFTSRTEAEHHK